MMGIFNYFLPDLDSMFHQGMAQEYDLLPQQHGGTVQSMDKWYDADGVQLLISVRLPDRMQHDITLFLEL